MLLNKFLLEVPPPSHLMKPPDRLTPALVTTLQSSLFYNILNTSVNLQNAISYFYTVLSCIQSAFLPHMLIIGSKLVTTVSYTNRLYLLR